MTYQTCEDCGTKMSGGYCSNCNEEIFIQRQYEELGQDVPPTIVEIANKQMQNPAKAYQPKYK